MISEASGFKEVFNILQLAERERKREKEIRKERKKVRKKERKKEQRTTLTN